jgi:predicted DNA-binding WGR domain protein
MIKLYKKGWPVAEYHEAWVSDGEITEHWGRIGTEGKTRMHRADPKLDDDANLERVLAKARSKGFEELAEDDERTLLVEYPVNGMGNVKDVDKRLRLEDKLNEVLGWTGLGHCDGGSIGSGAMEACCFVADFEVAAAVIREALAGTEFADFSRIYDENEA